MIIKHEQIFEEIHGILKKMDDDLILSYEILPNSRLIEDLGFESIDIVILCTTIETHFQQ
ncbi:hypothetical protein [Desulfobacula sp.]|uniref:hypothetical protein n=1 Tax=Desulfobacula sp. TaxID=2593537 RepID=UPI00261A7680|nr:hypothetical protein [Desulfobacula sp.]